MNHSLACVNLAKTFEGFRGEAYQDSVGVWTLGYGHTKGVHSGMSCTEEQAAVWLDCDMQEADTAVNKLVTAPLEQAQFDALVDFVFNLGQGSLAGSTLLRRVNECAWDEAAAEFSRWIYAGGRRLEGLVKRRAAEAALFMSAPGIRAIPTSEQIAEAARENNV